MLTRSLLIGAREKNSYRGVDALGSHISSAVSRALTYKRALENSSTSTLQPTSAFPFFPFSIVPRTRIIVGYQ